MNARVALGTLTAIALLSSAPGPALAEQSGFALEAGSLFEDFAPCVQARNRGVDIVAEYLDGDGSIRLRAGSWLGSDGRYLLPPPDDRTEAVRFRALEDKAIDSADVALTPCPAEFPASAAESLPRAIGLRLDRYFGDADDGADPAEAFRAAIEALSGTPQRHWLAVAHFEFASFLRAADRLEEAAGHYQAAGEIFGSLDDTGGYAASVNSHGLVALRQGRLEEAASRFRTAEPLFIELGDRGSVAATSNNLGLVYMRLDRLEEAATYLEWALSILQGQADLRSATPELPATGPGSGAQLTWALNTLNNLAIVRRRQGDVELAERYWRNVLALEGHVERARTGAEARHNLGALLIRQGRLDEALPMLALALERFDADRSRRWMSEVRLLLSQLYFHLDDTETALHFAREAADLAPEDLEARLRALSHLADLHEELDDPAAAIDTIDRALALISDRPGSRHQRLLESRRIHVSLLAGRAERPVEAQRAIHSAMLDQAQPGDSAVVAYRLGFALIAEGRHAEAEPILREALNTFRDTRRVFQELLTLEALGRIEGDSATALRFSEEAFERALVLRRQSLGEGRRLGLAATLGRIDDRHIGLLVDQGRPEAAWEAAARVRAGETIELRRAHRRGTLRTQRRHLLDRHGELLARLHERRLASDESQRETAEGRELMLEIDRVEARLRQLGGSATSDAAPTLGQVRSQLSDQQLLLSYYLMPEKGLLWSISATGADLFELPGAARIEATVSDFLERLRHPRQAIGAIGRLSEELGELLIEPASASIAGAGEILIEPHGSLQALPFALLVDGDSLLGDRASLRRIAALDTAEPAISAPGDEPPRMMVLANPSWQPDSAGAGALPERSLVGQLLRDGLLSGLPGTEREARLLAELDPASVAVSIRAGRTASRQFLLDGGLGGYPLIHIATHGLLDLQYPALSALLLADENGQGPSLLRPMEIAQLRLDARLVVLSGCETGTGPVPAGGGALSLARPFMVAGARNVLSTLWKIDDARTAEFMQVFYRHLIVERHSPARALAAAQRQMREQRSTAHPYYWAGFVLSGTSLAH